MIVEFPTPQVERIDYELGENGNELIDRVVYALDLPEDTPLVARYSERKQDPNRLVLARYTPSAYLKIGNIEAFQRSNAGLLRSALLKRLESSPHALNRTLIKLISAHEAFIEVLNKGKVLKGEALREWISSESPDFEEFLGNLDEESMQQVDDASIYESEALLEDVASDLVLLRELQ